MSLAKGCYMGQETLAKVYNLNATRRRLAGLRMSTAAAVGTPVMLGAASSPRRSFWRLQCKPMQGRGRRAIAVALPMLLMVSGAAWVPNKPWAAAS